MVDSARMDALLNEYKGNLFEFLFCHILAQKVNIEGKFLGSINPSMHSMLTQQESFLRNYYPNLLNELPILANEAVDAVLVKLKLKKVSEVSLIGKVAGNINNDYSEADILIKDDKNVFPLSLKVSKNSAFVNTKSAGLKSFFTKYFALFSVENIQQEFHY